MQTLRVLGGIRLSRPDGSEADALLRQPKHVALLAYLALPRPGTWHRRDSLLGVFWPELDESRARTSLRSALYALRRQLSDGTIRTRGDDEVSVDPALLSTDVGAMLDDFDAGRQCEALARYTGELLPALYIVGAEGFEPWLERERGRLQAIAQKAAAILSERLESANDLTGALDVARRAAELDPNDEAAVRRLIALLDKMGDRAQAFAVYERFRNHVRATFAVQPSAETTALVDAVRTRRSASSPINATTVPDTPRLDHGVEAQQPPPPIERQPIPSRLRVRRRWLGVAIGAAVTALVVAAYRLDVPEPKPTAGPTGKILVVLPMENETGDRSRDYIAAGIADEVGRRLAQIGELKVRSGARSDWPAAMRRDPQAVGRRFGAAFMLRSAIGLIGDSLEVRASLVDATTGSESPLPAKRFVMSDLFSIERELTGGVVGMIFRRPLPAVPRQPDHVIDPESYRLTLEAWHELLTMRREDIAKEQFLRATQLDPTNARAFAGLSSALAAQAIAEVIPFEAGAARASAAAERAIELDSLQGTAWANLGALRAIRTRDLASGVALLQIAKRVEPSNAEVFLIAAALYRHAQLWDKALDEINIARELDPLTPLYLERMASLELCAGRPNVAIPRLQAELVIAPSNSLALEALARALARVGRYDEAIVAWRNKARADHDVLIVGLLDSAHGEKGYWDARHAEGRHRLLTLERDSSRRWMSPLRFVLAHFAAGDTDAGFALLDSLVRQRMPALYKMPCMPDLDEVRGTPRYAAAVARMAVLR
ncbi:MAG TPA: BTAD domain-containing putative transcriptional regulator [Gemmatimonadaceae bacterium]